MIPNMPPELEELRALPQWIVWRGECTDKPKRKKVPYNPRSLDRASVINPATWTNGDEAYTTWSGEPSRFDGIGFVLTEPDPYTVIDLDDTGGNAALFEKHKNIVERFNSYTEFSPSGKGVHIWVRGVVPNGSIKNSALKVEVYSARRYMTVTGNVCHKAPIEIRQYLLDELCSALRKRTNTENPDFIANNPAPEISDDDVREFICGSDANRRNFEGEASDWSDAYYALICAVSLVTSDEAQARRVVMASPLVLNTPPKDGETRLHKAERRWASEYREAAAKGAQERQSSDRMRRSATIDTTLPPGFNFNGASATGDEAHWFSASDFAGKLVPPRVWHVRDLIPTGQPTMFSGDGGTGKSLIAMQLAIATVTGTQWLGLDAREGNALYLSAEDDRNELHRRIAAIGDMRSMHRLTLRSLAGQDALLAAPRDRTGVLARTPLFEDLDARMMAEKPVLLVLDTLADFFGGNENDRAQARQFIGMLRGLSIRHQCAVLLLSHPSVAGIASGVGTSGSTAWNNSVRSRLYLSRIVNNEGFEPNPDVRRLTVKKSNYGRIGKEILLHWHNGVFVGDDIPTLIENIAKAETVFLKLLSEFATQGRHVNAAGGQSYAPNVFADHPASAGITKRAFKAAMEKLLATGRIELIESGPASKRRSHLAIKGDVPTLFQPPSNPENGQLQPPSDLLPTPYQPPSNRGCSNPL